MRRLFPALLVFPLVLSAAVFPGKSWDVAAKPEDHGFASAGLAEVLAYAGTIDTSALMVVHSGVVVVQSGEVERKFAAHSMRKSFLSALYGRAVRDGSISLDATLADLGLDDVPPLTAGEKQATVRDCLKARSGIYHAALYESENMKKIKPPRGSMLPGAFWCYSNYDFNVLGTIYEQRTGRKIFEAMESEIARPIGMQDFAAGDGEYFHGEDSVHPAYPIRISARDLARFGLLMLHRGQWQGQQVIDADWVDESTRYHSDATLYRSDGYGYMWWVVRRHNKFPHLPGVVLPEGTYSAQGAFGHYLLVIPDYDLVISHRVNSDVPGKQVTPAQFGRLVALILAARQPAAH